MTVKKLIAYLLVLGSLLTILIYLLFSGPSKNDIRVEIERSNYCGSKEDCAIVQNSGAIKCNAFVNKGELDKIQTLIDDYGTKEAKACGEPVEPSCVQFQCK